MVSTGISETWSKGNQQESIHHKWTHKFTGNYNSQDDKSSHLLLRPCLVTPQHSLCCQLECRGKPLYSWTAFGFPTSSVCTYEKQSLQKKHQATVIHFFFSLYQTHKKYFLIDLDTSFSVHTWNFILVLRQHVRWERWGRWRRRLLWWLDCRDTSIYS